MKIKKTLISTEIDFTVSELREMRSILPSGMRFGLMMWLYKNFNLNLNPKLPTNKDENNSDSQ